MKELVKQIHGRATSSNIKIEEYNETYKQELMDLKEKAVGNYLEMETKLDALITKTKKVGKSFQENTAKLVELNQKKYEEMLKKFEEKFKSQ